MNPGVGKKVASAVRFNDVSGAAEYKLQTLKCLRNSLAPPGGSNWGYSYVSQGATSEDAIRSSTRGTGLGDLLGSRGKVGRVILVTRVSF